MKTTLKETLIYIRSDLPKDKSGVRSFIKNYFYNFSFRVMPNYRLGKYFYQHKFLFVRVLVHYYRARLMTKRNCEISYRANIGKNFKIAHPFGVVIGDGVVIKNNVTVFQQVTLGSHGKRGKNKGYPIVESGVKIFAGAKVFGGVTIGENSIIGANSVVNINVPPNSIAVGIPCKVIKSL